MKNSAAHPDALLNLLVTSFTIAFLCAFIVLGEPRHRGRPLTAWLKDLSDARSGPKQEEAAAAVRQIGEKAIPYLLQMIRPPGAALYMGLERFPKIAEVLYARKQPWTGHELGELGFRALGVSAGPAIPELVSMISDPVFGEMAVPALIAIGETVIPDMLPLLESTNMAIRYRAVTILGNLKKQPQTVVPKLIDQLHPTVPHLQRMLVARALGEYGPAATAGIPGLVELLHYPRSALSAAQGLIGIGGEAEIPVLHALFATDPKIRSAAAAALTLSFDLDDGQCLSLSLSTWDFDQKHRRAVCQFVVFDRTPPAQQRKLTNLIVTAVAARLSAPDDQVKIVAATTLGKLGSPSRAASGILLKTLKESKNDQVREAVREAIAMIESPPTMSHQELNAKQHQKTSNETTRSRKSNLDLLSGTKPQPGNDTSAGDQLAKILSIPWASFLSPSKSPPPPCSAIPQPR